MKIQIVEKKPICNAPCRLYVKAKVFIDAVGWVNVAIIDGKV